MAVEYCRKEIARKGKKFLSAKECVVNGCSWQGFRLVTASGRLSRDRQGS